MTKAQFYDDQWKRASEEALEWLFVCNLPSRLGFFQLNIENLTMGQHPINPAAMTQPEPHPE